MNKVSRLSLLSIETRLRAGGDTIAPRDSARVSPLAHRHVIPKGTYHFDRVGQ